MNKLGINVNNIESIRVYDAKLYTDWKWYEARSPKYVFFGLICVIKEIARAGYYYEEYNIDGKEVLIGPKSPAEIVADRNDLFIKDNEPHEKCVYKKPTMSVYMRSKNSHSFTYDTMDDIETALAEMQEISPIPVQWFPR